MYNKNKYFVGNMNLEGKGVVCRFDYNVPKNKEGEVTDDFRVASTISTIELILKKNPKYLVLASHFGRPKGKDENLSTKFLIPILEKYLQKKIKFLQEGISEESVKQIQDSPSGIYLLENLRFHKEETSYEKDSNICLTEIYKEFGDVFICDAFGCAHRKHLSIYAPSTFNKMFGYGLLIKKEVEAINSLLNTKNKRVLGIIGGNKIADKMPIIQSLKKIKNAVVFVAGGLAKQFVVSHENEIVMFDGFGASDLVQKAEYIEDIKNTDKNVYDIGDKSLQMLNDLVALSDVIFWNGSLGLIEKPEYRIGSEKLINVLLGETCEGKTIIMGGGETASLIRDKSQNRIYVSTGGGALLEYLENKLINNKTLVGLEIYNM
jgi:phosphoglycerate kinase